MIINLLLITSAAALLCLGLLIRNHSKTIAKSASCILAMALMTLRIILLTFLSLDGVDLTDQFYLTHGITSLIILPLIHLHFRQLTENRTLKSYDLVHALPVVLGLCLYPIKDNDQIRWGLIFIAPVLGFYWILMLLTLKKGVWSRESGIGLIIKNIRQVRGVSNFLFGLVTLGLIYNLSRALFFEPQPPAKGINYLIIPSMLLLLFSIKLLWTPEILYGFDIVPKMMESTSNKHIFHDIWIYDVKVPVKSKIDQGIKDKVRDLLDDYLFRIEDAGQNSPIFNQPGLTIEDFAIELKIPAFHMSYLFRYHSKESFSDFKKIIRIKNAIQLMKSGYLRKNTLQSLATAVGFSSQNPFFVSFKSITGTTPNQYAKTLEVAES
jgi:AraC-like DNA-binding protein